MTFAALVLSGLALGAAYALVALGLLLVLRATSVINFAHGDLVVAGGLVGAALGWSGGLSLAAVAAVSAMAGLLVAAATWLPFRGRDPSAPLIATIALGLIVQNGLLLGLGPAPRAAPPLIGSDWGMIGVAAVLVAGLHTFLFHTWTGKRLRAAADNPEMARAFGIPVTRMTLASFAIGTALAGVAGFLLAGRFFLTPFDGAALILKAYVAITIGGWGSLAGTVAGALLIALFEVLVSSYVSQTVALACLYGLLIVVLAWRPRGLFGEASSFRA